MRTSLFDFHLPEQLIAAAPVSPRDASRMLVVKEGCYQDSMVRSLPDFLKPGDIMVFNNTKVIPARLLGKRGEAGVEILLHKRLLISPPNAVGTNIEWAAFAKPAKRLKEGDHIAFAEDFHATVIAKEPDGQVRVRFESEDFQAKLLKYGQMPLPPYIEKKRTVQPSDYQNYQTVYATHEGSVAAPTAGLHFTPELLQAFDMQGVQRAYITLHVGGGTFLPVKAEDTQAHIMHREWVEISEETVTLINEAKSRGNRVIAVGTTSLRALESAADEQGVLQPFSADTNIFITPGYKFRLVDVLLTNFHLPKSTLFMLVSAFSGLEIMQKAYQHAISRHYRFYSYGDACLLFPH